MSDLVFIAFDDEKQAEEVRDKVTAFSPDLLARRPSYDERRGAKPPNNWDQNVATLDEMKSRWGL